MLRHGWHNWITSIVFSDGGEGLEQVPECIYGLSKSQQNFGDPSIVPTLAAVHSSSVSE